MTTGARSPFQRAMTYAHDRTRLGTATLLAWVAASDGNVTPGEYKLLQEFTGERQRSDELDVALKVGREPGLDDLLLACNVVRSLPQNSQHIFLRWAVSVAISDDKLSSISNYILRFFAELANLDLSEVFGQVTSSALPAPGDPSSIAWWTDRDQARAATSDKAESSREQDKQSTSGSKRRRGQMTRLEALAILGMEPNATEDEIAQAFRQLASVHHPDRFSQSTPEEQRAASKSFSRVRAAFEMLKQQ